MFTCSLLTRILQELPEISTLFADERPMCQLKWLEIVGKPINTNFTLKREGIRLLPGDTGVLQQPPASPRAGSRFISAGLVNFALRTMSFGLATW